MKDQPVPAAVARRRFWIRAALIVVLVGLAVLVFVLGKGHSLLVDNKDAEGGSVAGLEGVTVSVDGREASEMYPGDRDMVKVTGQRHRVVVETMEGERIEKTIILPMGKDMLLLSIPMLVAGREPMLSVFLPKDIAPPEEDTGNSNAFTAPTTEEAKAAVDAAAAADAAAADQQPAPAQ